MKKTEAETRFVNVCYSCYVVDLLPFGCRVTKCLLENWTDLTETLQVEKEDRRLEAIEINKSLSALGDVIEAGSGEPFDSKSLSHVPQAVAKKKKYIPYRSAACQTRNMDKPRQEFWLLI